MRWQLVDPDRDRQAQWRPRASARMFADGMPVTHQGWSSLLDERVVRLIEQREVHDVLQFPR
jgi:hypothetical protein